MSNYGDSSFEEGNTSWSKAGRLVPKGATVLDVGCSSGNFGKALIDQRGCQVDGIEPDAGDAKLARTKLRKVWELDIERDSLKPLGTAKYDIIYFGDVIEHLIHPEKALARIQPFLKKGGAVLFSIPNMSWIGVRLALIKGDFDYTETGLLDKTHIHFYTQKEVVRVFEHAGYRVKHLDFVKKDYPRELLRQYLSTLGLKPNNTFFKHMAATDASAFQFVGVAVPGKVRRGKLPQFGPIDMFETFYNDTLQQLQAAEAELAHRKAHPYRALAKHLKTKFVRR